MHAEVTTPLEGLDREEFSSSHDTMIAINDHIHRLI
jgi:hypothetical protein